MSVLDLWVPILVASVAGFFLSFLTWAVLRHHDADVKYCADQHRVLDLVKNSTLEPGVYIFPSCADRKDFRNPEMQELFNAGPWGTLSIWPGKPNMARNMALTLGYFFLVSLLVAYLTAIARPAGSDFLAVFQVATTAAILANVLGGMPNGIWFGKRLRFFITDALDGVLYSVGAGAVFGLMWPTLESVATTTP